MLWLVQFRRRLAVLTLLMLVAPAVGIFAGSLSRADAHTHMHGVNHGVAMDSQGMLDAGHDKLLCSVMIPCEHGFCAGLALLLAETPATPAKWEWIAESSKTVRSTHPGSLSPPPRSHS